MRCKGEIVEEKGFFDSEIVQCYYNEEDCPDHVKCPECKEFMIKKKYAPGITAEYLNYFLCQNRKCKSFGIRREIK